MTIEQSRQTFASIGIDIGKDVFYIVGFESLARWSCAGSSSAFGWKPSLAKLPPSIVGLEACLSAHFVGRTLRRFGHTLRIIPAIYAKPFSKGQNDYNDAEAIAEAALRPNLRVVREKTRSSSTYRPCTVSARLFGVRYRRRRPFARRLYRRRGRRRHYRSSADPAVLQLVRQRTRCACRRRTFQTCGKRAWRA
jgi:hypothetical protein